jgi:phenylalanyl-tRNA synthetase beta chain
VVERDLSFVLDKQTEYNKLEEQIKSLNIEELQDIRVIDLYSGSGLPDDRIAVTMRLTFGSDGRTLTQEEATFHCDRILSLLRSTVQAVPRS